MLEHGQVGGEARRQPPALALGECHERAAAGEGAQRLGSRQPLARAHHLPGAHVAAGDDGGEGDPGVGRLVVGGDAEPDALAEQAAMRQKLVGGAAEPGDLVAGRAIQVRDRVRRGDRTEPTDPRERLGARRVEVDQDPAQVGDRVAPGDVFPDVEHLGQAARDQRVHAQAVARGQLDLLPIGGRVVGALHESRPARVRLAVCWMSALP